jgi:ubiquitin carboxyl-terminal hydrolase 10
MFLREFPVIDSAESAQKLQMRLKDGELEQYGEAFTPEYVYEAIKKIPRFSSMRVGQTRMICFIRMLSLL